tara:strand:+ start:12022 stop:12273 length:252 start_codon:yes stop_codon:yes gene_type:complete
MKPSSVEFKFQLLAWIMHIAGLVLAFWGVDWIQTQLVIISNDWISKLFAALCVLYLAAVTLRIYNGTHPAPKLLQQYFGGHYQ